MDYKKKYEDALERAKKFIEANPLVQNLNTWIKETFPEIAESEDEWVRRTLIEEFQTKAYSTFAGYPIPTIITWLEKQKPVEYVGWRENRPDNKPKVKQSVLMLTTHGVAEGEWLGGEWCQYRWSCNVKDEDVLYWMPLSDLELPNKE